MAKKPQARARKAAKKTKALETTGAAGALPSLSTIISQILDAIRRTGAQAVNLKPLPSGTVGVEVPIKSQSLQQLFTAAATQGNQSQQVWTQDSSELTVTTGKVSVTLDDGLILVNIPVSCDQVLSAMIQVPFATGSKDLPTGMVCATESRPRGPEIIVDVWGDALIAFAWHLVLTVTSKVSAQSGVDEDGAGLVPIGLTVAKDGLTLLPIARHTFDRVQP